MRKAGGTYPRNRRKTLSSYYRRQAAFYDWSRWAFLFGRESLLDRLPELPAEPVILEVGCGTGQVLEGLLRRYPTAEIYGVDLSSAMLARAAARLDGRQKLNLVEGWYGSGDLNLPECDLVICSYSLTMTGTAAERILQRIHADLKPKGCLAAVDFHTTPVPLFYRWMARNHVCMDGRLLPMIKKYFRPEKERRRRAYLGTWSWFQFVGRRGDQPLSSPPGPGKSRPGIPSEDPAVSPSAFRRHSRISSNAGR